MAQEKITLPAAVTSTRIMKVTGWYQPHSTRSHQDGSWTDPRTGQVTVPPSRTKQEFVQECDINNIIKSYKLTGQIAHINANAGKFEDLPDTLDFQESMNTVVQAQDAFAALPSHIRARFGNDPTNFLQFLQDPANQDEAIRLGLAKDTRPPPEPPQPPPAPPEANKEPPAKSGS